ncbi:MAG: hypothetical protein ACI9HK_003039 [Pirellulaceae bacterium]|jgi:hypothetical protein
MVTYPVTYRVTYPAISSKSKHVNVDLQPDVVKDVVGYSLPHFSVACG